MSENTLDAIASGLGKTHDEHLEQNIFLENQANDASESPDSGGHPTTQTRQSTARSEDEGAPEGRGTDLTVKKDVEGEDDASEKLVAIPSAGDLNDSFGDADEEEYHPSPVFKERGYTKLRELFQKVIVDLEDAREVGIPMEEVQELFYTVWDSVEKSHSNEMNLIRKDCDLTTELTEVMARTKGLIKLAEEDPELAAKLGRRLEAAWSLVDIGDAEEKINTEKIEILRDEIFTLNRNIATAANLDGLDHVNDLQKSKKRLTEDRDALLKESGKLRTSVELLREKRSQQADRKMQFQELIKISLEEAVSQKEAIARETARKEAILVNIDEAMKTLEQKEIELNELGEKVLNGQQKITELENNAKEAKISNEAAMREVELSNQRMDKLKQDLEAQAQVVERMTVESLARSQELKLLEDDVNNIKAEQQRTSRLRNTNLKKCQILESSLANVEAERENMKGKIAVLEKELDGAQKTLEENKKKVDELDKERTIFNRNLQRAVAVTEDHENQAKTHAVAVANLQAEMNAFHREIKSQLNAIDKIEAERDWYAREATKLANYAALGMEEVKKVSGAVFDVRKRVSEVQEEFKKAEQVYEMISNEKANSEKMLREMEINVFNTEVKLRHTIFELNALNYQLYDKEKFYVIEVDKRERIARQAKFFKEESKRMSRMALDVKRQVEALEVERSTLGCMIAEIEGEIAKQKYYRNSAESRKLHYQRKLMIKEHELREVIEKWRTLHSRVRIGAYHYRNLMREIREIRQYLVNIRRVQFHFKSSVNHVRELRQEIAVLENCISKEVCMVNTLTDQLKRPKNVHRWRSLEALNPEAYTRVKKINMVTTRLVERNAEILKHSEIMRGKEEILVEIRKLLSRSPGLETPEERLYLEHLVIAKKRQLSTLKRELITAEGQTTYYRKEVDKLNSRYKEIRATYFNAKKEDPEFGNNGRILEKPTYGFFEIPSLEDARKDMESGVEDESNNDLEKGSSENVLEEEEYEGEEREIDQGEIYHQINFNEDE